MLKHIQYYLNDNKTNHPGIRDITSGVCSPFHDLLSITEPEPLSDEYTETLRPIRPKPPCVTFSMCVYVWQGTQLHTRNVPLRFLFSFVPQTT